jgi:5-methylcytosine-specific restriction endonuclease McrA
VVEVDRWDVHDIGFGQCRSRTEHQGRSHSPDDRAVYDAGKQVEAGARFYMQQNGASVDGKKFAHPVCKFCLERGIVTAANVVDHVVPHKGDWTDFVTGELQSLCEPCHNSAKRQIELRGYRCDVGIDGYRPPVQPRGLIRLKASGCT